MSSNDIRFLYDEAAIILTAQKNKYLVIGDLHIGRELVLHKKGIRIEGATEFMSKRINAIMKQQKISNIVLLGDIKDSVLRPDTGEARLIRNFLDSIAKFNITIVAGNHDAYIKEITGSKLISELILGDFALLHGNRKPTPDAMKAHYLITAHNHAAVSIMDDNGAIYTQKAWLIAPLDHKHAASHYLKANDKIKLVVMPAFNELIVGTPVNTEEYEKFSVLFRNNIFDYSNADVYSRRGELLGRCRELAKLNRDLLF